MTFQEALDNLCAKYSIFGFEREFLAEFVRGKVILQPQGKEFFT